MIIHKNVLKVIVFIIFIFYTIQLFSQEQDKIEIIKKPLGTLFKLNGKSLRVSEIIEITSSDSVSQEEMKLAKKNFALMNFFSTVGGGLIGWPIGTQIGGGEPQWELAVIGAGFAIISIPFQMKYTKHTTKAINEFYSNNHNPFKINQLQFAVKPNGLYFSYNF